MRLRSPARNKRGIDTIIASLLMVIIVVIMSVMVYAYSTGLLTALLIAPNQPKEAMKLEYSSFATTDSARNVTLYIRNIGSAIITFTGYYVKDMNGNQYSQINWLGQGPQVSPTLVAPATILISTKCSGCTTTGTAFTFSSGNAYTVTLVTSRNAQFTFNIVA